MFGLRASGQGRIIGLREDELDLRHRHFGPTAWLGHSGQWALAVGRDHPQAIYVLAEVNGSRRVVAALAPGDPLPEPGDTELVLRYYRRSRGRSAAVCLALCALQQAAD